MNFKGTTNIPRDKVKGIIEQFGGYWNGYTWIDQTTYTETATRDALDRMLFIESERMASCLYDPADCESERTVIISELQGGENDPDQLLHQELTATAFRAHPYGHPPIGRLGSRQRMTRHGLYRCHPRHPISVTATEGSSLGAVEEATLAQLDAVRRHGITAHELDKAKNQLRARLVFEGDSVSNIAHQLGYFETVASWRLVPSLRERVD